MLTKTTLLAVIAGLTAIAGSSAVMGIGSFLPADYGLPACDSMDVCYNPVDDEYFVVYVGDDAPGAYDGELYGRRIKADGTPIGEPILIDTSGNTSPTGPSIAHARESNRYMIAYKTNDRWGYPSTLAARLLTNAGVDVSPGGGPIYHDWGDYTLFPVDIASDGRNFLALCWAWGPPLLAWTLNSDGGVLESFSVPVSSDTSFFPTLSYLGGAADAYLVAYADGDHFADSSTPSAAIRTRVIKADLSVGPEQQLSADTPGNRDRPRIAANEAGQEWLVAWESISTRYEPEADLGYPYADGMIATGDIIFRRVASDGSPIGASEIALQSGAQDEDFLPAVTWSASEGVYLISWEHQEYYSGFASDGILPTFYIRCDIRTGQVVGGTDRITRNFREVTSTPSIDEQAPLLAASDGNGDVLCVWTTVWTHDPAWTNFSYDPVIHATMISAYNPPPAAPDPLFQCQADGMTVIESGGITRETAVVFRGGCSDPENDRVSLQVELKEAGVPFSPSPSASELVTGMTAASGGVASVTVDVELNKAYHWRARTVDEAGKASTAWISFNSGSAPDFRTEANTLPAISWPAQRMTSVNLPIAPGGMTNDRTLLFLAAIDDGDLDPVRIEVQVAPAALPFTDDMEVHAGPLAPSGGAPSVQVTLGAGPYHWRFRPVDKFNGRGGWSDFAGSADPAPDFVVNAFPTAVAIGQYAGSSSVPVGNGQWVEGGKSILVRARVNDPDGDGSRIELEARPIGTPFSGVAMASGAPVADGQEAEVSLPLPFDRYHWQYRVVDSHDGSESWIRFGGNAESEPDFVLDAGGSLGPKNCLGSAGGAVDRMILAILLAIACLRMGSRR